MGLPDSFTSGTSETHITFTTEPNKTLISFTRGTSETLILQRGPPKCILFLRQERQGHISIVSVILRITYVMFDVSLCFHLTAAKGISHGDDKAVLCCIVCETGTFRTHINFTSGTSTTQ